MQTHRSCQAPKLTEPRYRHRIDISRLVFIDETWTKTNMAPLRGWATWPTPEGQGAAPTMEDHDLLAALRHDRLEAPWLIDGPINGERFRLYVEKVLLPTLRPGDIVVMDNLGSHRSKALGRAIRSVGAKLFFLPKYSPDLNPIEQFFAKLKHWLRQAAKRTPMPSATQSATSSAPSLQPNAATISSTQAMNRPDFIRL